jgi:hypothetical protein
MQFIVISFVMAFLMSVLTLMPVPLRHAENDRPYPRLLVLDADRDKILSRIVAMDWASSIYLEMYESVTPYADRHQTDSEWILSRYQMNWAPGAHYTTHISDPQGTALIARSGNAPYPTVRVTTHKRRPIAPDGYAYRQPYLDEIKPYNTDSLWYMQSSGPSGEWSYADPRLMTGSINARINSLAVESAILYWLTEDEKYARFASDILFQWARGAYYQNPVEGAGRNGLFCVQSLGDRGYDDLAIAYDFVRLYMQEAGYQTRYFQPVFEKLAKTTKLRGFVTNNWYAAQTTTLTYNALSLDDPEKRDYYLSFYLERDTVDGIWGQLALPTTMQEHFTDDGHWKENAGYHDMPVGDLLMAAVPVENNGYRVFQNHPGLYQASYAMLRYSFPNLQLMGYGDIGGRRYQSPRNLEIAIRYAADYAPELLPGLTASLKSLIDAGLYDRSQSGWFGLLTYLTDFPEIEATFEWETSFSLDFARLYGHRNGTDQETGLMYYVQGATYNHNHANGMAMELYGRGYILGADPGISVTYEDSVFVHYLATFAAHNTVIAAGASEPSVPFLGSGGSKHMGEISLAAMEPLAGEPGVSPYVSFTVTDYLEPSTDTQQQRTMAIVRTSPETGYYVDIYRSNNEISNDYIYHNIGHGVALYDMNREALSMRPGVIPFRPDRQSGMGWFENIMTPQVPSSGATTGLPTGTTTGLPTGTTTGTTTGLPAGATTGTTTGLPAGTTTGNAGSPEAFTPASLHNAISVFHLQESGPNTEDVFMQLLMPLDPADKLFTATGPRTRTAPAPIHHLPTPKTIIHRPEPAWNEPFAVIFEPYRGDDGYSVASVHRISTEAPFTALEVINRDGTRQLIMQSDQPQTTQTNGELHLQGHFGVVSLDEAEKIQYLYLGHGTSMGWNGYQLEKIEGQAGASVRFNDNSVVITNNGDIRLRLPYRVSDVRDQTDQLLQFRFESATTAQDAFTIIDIPAGSERKIYLKQSDS